MNRIAFDAFARAAALAAAVVVSACAAAKPAPSSAPAKPARTAAMSAAPSVPTVQPPAPVPLPAGPLTRVGGVVVSEDGRSLTIKEYGGRLRLFRVADGARITRGGREAMIGLDAIAAGDRVRLKVGADVIASVHVMVSPAR